MALNWFDFADKDDVIGHELYLDLIDAKIDGRSMIDTWVKVPKKALHLVRRPHWAEDVPFFWNGFDWVEVRDYEAKGKVYIRLPQPHEVSE